MDNTRKESLQYCNLILFSWHRQKKPVVSLESEEIKPSSPVPHSLTFTQTLNDPPSGPHLVGFGRHANRDKSPRDTHSSADFTVRTALLLSRKRNFCLLVCWILLCTYSSIFIFRPDLNNEWKMHWFPNTKCHQIIRHDIAFHENLLLSVNAFIFNGL